MALCLINYACNFNFMSHAAKADCDVYTNSVILIEEHVGDMILSLPN